MNIRVDPEVKSNAQDLFSKLGMDMSTAVNIFLRQAIREQSIPFAITLETPNNITKTAIINSKSGKNVVGPFDTVDELMENLNNN